jgi:hypothetical protein
VSDALSSDTVDQVRGLAAQAEMEKVVHFRRDVVPFVLLDCLHLSIMTMTTVGYGDVTPEVWYSKLATDAQALTGVAILVIALGLFLSGSAATPVRPPPTSEATPPH